MGQLFKIRLERDDLDGGWVAECPGLPGCMSQGETEGEAMRGLGDVVMEWLVCAGRSGGVTDPAVSLDVDRRLIDVEWSGWGPQPHRSLG